MAGGSATASSGDTTVLATVVCEPPPQPLWKQRLFGNFLEVSAGFHHAPAGGLMGSMY